MLVSSYNNSYHYKYGYQGQFAEKDDETNESFFELRNYDPLIARFKTTDPCGQYWSPYMAMGNNHPNSIDPDGGFNYGGMVTGMAIGAGVGMVGALASELAGDHNSASNFVNATPYLMAAGAVGGGFGGEIAEFAGSPMGEVAFAGTGMATQQFGMSASTFTRSPKSETPDVFNDPRFQRKEYRGNGPMEIIGGFGKGFKLGWEMIKGLGKFFTKKTAVKYSAATLNAFKTQLAKHGRSSLLKSQTKIQRRLAEHLKKLTELKKSGGQTSSVEREIRTFQGQLDALKELLK